MPKIRRAQVSDAAVLGEILSLSWQAAYKGIVPEGILERLNPESRAEVFVSLFAEGNGEISLALEDGQAAGFVMTGKCRDEDAGDTCGEVWSVYLKPEYWRKGIGTALLSHGMEQLKEQGYTKAVLWVIEGNSSAAAFYEKNGFKPDGTRRAIEIGKTLYEVRYIRGI